MAGSSTSRRINNCKTCGSNMMKRDSKGVLTALKLHYGGLYGFIQIVCKCGMQTRKVGLLEKVSVYDIWNGRAKKK